MSKMVRLFFFTSVLVMFLAQACTIVGERGLLSVSDGPGESCAVPAAAITKTEIDYAADVVPILQDKGCIGCHGGTAGVKFDEFPDIISVGTTTGGPIVIPCDFEASTLFSKISPTCDSPFKSKMPIGGDPLTEEEAGIIQQWIAEGANGTFDAGTCVQ